jgi:hypothetical protein
MVDLTTKHDKFARVNQCIREAAREAAEHGLSASVVERFLRTGDRTLDGAGSGLFSSASSRRTKFTAERLKPRCGPCHLGELLPAEARLKAKVASEEIQRRLEPMVMGLVQSDWQEVALRELTARTFVLNFQGAAAALDTELSSGYVGGDTTGRRILWVCFDNYGLKPERIKVPYDGVACNFAHVRWSVGIELARAGL